MFTPRVRTTALGLHPPEPILKIRITFVIKPPPPSSDGKRKVELESSININHSAELPTVVPDPNPS
ncbi:hypothetical protein K440DRAFT_609273 [Wilcoxina mikolae CBS 423.85]|nr:hypothetical protein K440DRAFT_609273 [Wilcoxina mikolae CBS 423.85]